MAQSGADASAFFSALGSRAWNPSQIEVGIFPSFVHLPQVVKTGATVNGLVIGAQDCSAEEKGAFTGEVSAAQIREIGVTHILIGHSERRQRVPETPTSLSAKLKWAKSVGLQIVFCIGETEAERDAGKLVPILKSQLDVLKGENLDSLLVAYEPVWAIGTGKTASLKDVEEAHGEIKRMAPGLKGILYGGSVNAQNSGDILQVPGVDGLLVGGASLKPDTFLKIIASGA